MTFDLQTSSGELVEIEARSEEEVKGMWGVDENGNQIRIQISNVDTKVHNPAFDITPHRYISGFITEKGLLRAPYNESISLNITE
jgi:methylthioribose-1-phosphate isomerase